MPSVVRSLEWTAWARADLLAIVDYISDDNPDAAQHLKDELVQKAERLREFPDCFALDGYRERERWSRMPTTLSSMSRMIRSCAFFGYFMLRSSGLLTIDRKNRQVISVATASFSRDPA